MPRRAVQRSRRTVASSAREGSHVGARRCARTTTSSATRNPTRPTSMTSRRPATWSGSRSGRPAAFVATIAQTSETIATTGPVSSMRRSGAPGVVAPREETARRSARKASTDPIRSYASTSTIIVLKRAMADPAARSSHMWTARGPASHAAPAAGGPCGSESPKDTRRSQRTDSRRALSRHEHELSAHVTLLAHAVRVARLGEREGLRDRRLQAPRLEQRRGLAERLGGPEVAAAGDLDAERRGAEVGDRRHAGRVAGERDEVRHGALARGVEREVDALGRERADALDEAVAVGRRLGAERPQEVVVPLAGGPDDPRAARPRELDGGGADSARGPVDEQRLPLAHAAEDREDPHARLDRDRQRRRLLPRQARRLARVVVEDGVLGRPAADREAEDLVAGLDAGRVGPDLVDDARRLAPVDHGELQRHHLAHHAAARLPVDRVDAGGTH